MSEEILGKVFEMISAAGTARSKYMEAISRAKAGKMTEADALIAEGGECFLAAHKIHGEMLTEESSRIVEGGNTSMVNLILVHAEDQMMCAETFRLMAQELIDVYKKMGNQ